MPLLPVLSSLLSRASRALGLESVDRFPPGHQYPRTRWDRAYFDIASDLKTILGDEGTIDYRSGEASLAA